ncbi:uncharacterized protein CLUP02_10964 [Colletotrichum lupini]|uniref:Uncharacterized protein n=1 Tax=Colletotrichum lupini TaxID=145971 RepID=A0A9Q8SZD4_9PEZI|nr:uncharacterized protein CLUP02_10964 [Colletotrichum lupini]UQC85466.1 hypothetical protein CLUP02_10964 [Colletotrichum lupini]
MPHMIAVSRSYGSVFVYVYGMNFATQEKVEEAKDVSRENKYGARAPGSSDKKPSPDTRYFTKLGLSEAVAGASIRVRNVRAVYNSVPKYPQGVSDWSPGPISALAPIGGLASQTTNENADNESPTYGATETPSICEAAVLNAAGHTYLTLLGMKSLTGGKTRLSGARVFHRLVIRPLPLSPDSSNPRLTRHQCQGSGSHAKQAIVEARSSDTTARRHWFRWNIHSRRLSTGNKMRLPPRSGGVWNHRQKSHHYLPACQARVVDSHSTSTAGVWVEGPPVCFPHNIIIALSYDISKAEKQTVWYSRNSEVLPIGMTL